MPVGKQNSPKFDVRLETFEVATRGLAELFFLSTAQTIIALMEYILEKVSKPLNDENLVKIRLGFTLAYVSKPDSINDGIPGDC